MNRKKIAILGSENSHCTGFASSLCPLNGESRYKDLELVGIYGDAEANAAVLEKAAVPFTTEDPNAFLGKVDSVMVTARHGGRHLSLARPYIEAGLPVWIDKPITASVEEAIELVRLVKEKKILICGGSSLAGASVTVKMKQFVEEYREDIIGGHVTAPVKLVNNYGNFWFYSQHLVQIVTEVFGQKIVDVRAVQKGNGVHVMFRYPNFDVTGYFGTGYSITVYGDGFTKASEIALADDYYCVELDEFNDMLQNGHVRQTPAEVVYPVTIIDAVIKSMEKNGEAVTPLVIQ